MECETRMQTIGNDCRTDQYNTKSFIFVCNPSTNITTNLFGNPELIIICTYQTMIKLCFALKNMET